MSKETPSMNSCYSRNTEKPQHRFIRVFGDNSYSKFMHEGYETGTGTYLLPL